MAVLRFLPSFCAAMALAAAAPVGAVAPVRYDFDSSGRPDLVYRHAPSGATYIWRMNGLALASDQYVTAIDPSWDLIGHGDFDGDGKNDLVWRSRASGTAYVWYMNDGAFVSDAFLFTIDPVWKIETVADFNNDGKPDFLFRHSTSGVGFLWYFNNTTPGADQFLYSIDNSWIVENVGDFDRDGYPDFFFRNVSSGLGFVWYWNGTALGASNFLFSIDPVWQVVQIADWNNDTFVDLVFRNDSTGVTFVWYTNGTSLQGSDFIVQIDPSWKIVPREIRAATLETIAVGSGPFPLPGDDPAVRVDGVGRNAGGDLVRDASAFAHRFLWVPNDRQGTVSKIDVLTGAEVARYASVTHDAARVVNHVARGYPAWNADANANSYADNRPQYTAIDFRGDAWVANVAHDAAGLQSTLTKIHGNNAACPDLNGNGVVDTSREVNGTPGIQLTDPLEFLGEADECIAMTVVVGNAGTGNGGIRAIAIDAGRGGVGSDAGNPWVGMHSEQAFYQIHGATGAIVQRVATPGVRAFTAAIDSLGRLWARDFCCGTVNLGRIDAAQNPAPFTLISTTPPFSGFSYGNYGLTVDLENRVWVAGHPYGGAMRYDPGPGTWAEAQITGYASNGQARGVAVDGRGSVWTSFHPGGADGLVARIDTDNVVATGTWQLDDSSGGLANIPTGVGIDFAGNVWTVNQTTSNVSRMHIDPATGNPAAHPVTGDVIDVFPVGANPYVHSDFTGLGYRRVTRPDGEYSARITPCAGDRPAHWLTAEWEATTPAGTRVELWLRAGNDAATVGQAPLQGPWTASPADLQSLPGPVGDRVALLFTLRLVSDNPAASPVVHSYRVTRTCPAP